MKFLVLVSTCLAGLLQAASASDGSTAAYDNFVRAAALGVINNHNLVSSIQSGDRTANVSTAVSTLAQDVDQMLSSIPESSSSGSLSMPALMADHVMKPYVESVASTLDSLSGVASNETLQDALSNPLTSLFSKAQSLGVSTGDLSSAVSRVGIDLTASSLVQRDVAAASPSASSSVYGYSEGTEMFAPVADATNSLLSQQNSAAGLIYTDIDALDHIVDATTAALGTILGPFTGNLVSGVADFLNGPIIQSINHGTYAVIARLVGDPADALLQDILPVAISFSNTVADFAQTMVGLNINADTTQLDQTNLLLRNRIQQINPQATFSKAIPGEATLSVPRLSQLSTALSGIAPSQASAIESLATAASDEPAVSAAVTSAAQAVSVAAPAVTSPATSVAIQVLAAPASNAEAATAAAPTTTTSASSSWWWPFHKSGLSKRQQNAVAVSGNAQCPSPDPTAVAQQLSKLVGMQNGGGAATVTVTVNGASASGDAGADGGNPLFMQLARQIPIGIQNRVANLSDQFAPNGTIDQAKIMSMAQNAAARAPMAAKNMAQMWAAGIPSDLPQQLSSVAQNLPSGVPQQFRQALQNVPSDLPARISNMVNDMPTTFPPFNPQNMISRASAFASVAPSAFAQVTQQVQQAVQSQQAAQAAQADISNAAAGSVAVGVASALL